MVKEVISDEELFVDDSFMKELKESSSKVLESLQEGLSEKKVDAEVFVGGSFAKGSMMKSSDYDIDVFVRFDWKYENLSENLSKAVKFAGKKLGKKVREVHGSRDYYQILYSDDLTSRESEDSLARSKTQDSEASLTFEIIPVSKITKPEQERNVTDLSYFHVNYVKKKLKDKDLVREILLAKKFCKANNFYGAESYIEGFSGYALECLIIYYGSFEKMLKELIKVGHEKLIIDIEKDYKTKAEVFMELNDSKTQGPVILIDPTWKERNVLAGLGEETFRKFQTLSSEFLENPDKSFFERKEFSKEDFEKYAKKKKFELIEVELETDRQEGDIAGTKMKKFARHLVWNFREFFEVSRWEFVYHGLGSKAKAYFILKSKGDVLKEGPPLVMERNAKVFMKANKEVFSKKGKLWVKKREDSGLDFLKSWWKKNKWVGEGMGISGLKVN